VVAGMRRPNQWIREVQVVPFSNIEMVSLFVAPGISVQQLEKHRMYLHRLSPYFCL
jgi:hypothetical protein